MPSDTCCEFLARPGQMTTSSTWKRRRGKPSYLPYGALKIAMRVHQQLDGLCMFMSRTIHRSKWMMTGGTPHDETETIINIRPLFKAYAREDLHKINIWM